MNEPTKEQIQGFWEQCGLKNLSYDRGVWFNWLSHTNKDGKRERVPPIDLNNLFKYAVPKLIQKIGKSRTTFVLQHWVHEVAMHDEDPALALFWAIYKAFGGA